MKLNGFYLVVLSLVSLPCFGQATPTRTQTSEVIISVKDEEGAVIGKAFLLLRADHLERENPQPFALEARTDAAGIAKRSVPQGFYDVFVASTGFAPYCQKLRLRDGIPATINVVLKSDTLMTKEYGDTFEPLE